MVRRFVLRSSVLVLFALILPVWTIAGCDKSSEEEAAPSRDWRPVVEKIDLALVEEVLAAEGWALEDREPTETVITAEDVRSMGGKAEGDTRIRGWSASKDGLSASISFVDFPGDVKPATGGRMRSMGAVQVLAGSRSVDITVYDDEYAEQYDQADALMDALVAAAEKK